MVNNIKAGAVVTGAMFIALVIFGLRVHAMPLPKADTTFKQNHYSFEAGATFYSRADVVHLQGAQRLETRPAVSAQLGFMYGRYWKNGIGFRLGFRWSIIPLVYKYDLPYQVVDTALAEYGNLGSRWMFYDINHWQFPVQVSYYKPFRQSFAARLSAGLSVDWQANGQISSRSFVTYQKNSVPTQAELYNVLLNVNSRRAVHVSMPVELMFSKMWLGRHVLEFGIMYSVAFRPVASGYYIFLPDMPHYSYGTIAIKNTYVALKVCYTLLSGKRKDRLPQMLR